MWGRCKANMNLPTFLTVDNKNIWVILPYMSIVVKLDKFVLPTRV